jgi:hypothetical protein
LRTSSRLATTSWPLRAGGQNSGRWARHQPEAPAKERVAAPLRWRVRLVSAGSKHFEPPRWMPILNFRNDTAPPLLLPCKISLHPCRRPGHSLPSPRPRLAALLPGTSPPCRIQRRNFNYTKALCCQILPPHL